MIKRGLKSVESYFNWIGWFIRVSLSCVTKQAPAITIKIDKIVQKIINQYLLVCLKKEWKTSWAVVFFLVDFINRNHFVVIRWSLLWFQQSIYFLLRSPKNERKWTISKKKVPRQSCCGSFYVLKSCHRLCTLTFSFLSFLWNCPKIELFGVFFFSYLKFTFSNPIRENGKSNINFVSMDLICVSKCDSQLAFPLR